MTIYEQIKELLKDNIGIIVSSAEIKHDLYRKYETRSSSVLISDYCYNRYNTGIKFDRHLFQYINKSSYKFLGENYNYTGLIFHRPKGSQHEMIIGEWKNGEKIFYDNPITHCDQNIRNDNFLNISKEQIQKLYEEYNEILRLELNILNCKPTELRHLIGRIGEFYCAIKTNGVLSKETNQQGFDVVSNNRRISVKTTAQKQGFVVINQNTFDKFDDLFVVQYKDDDFNLVFYGPKEQILDIKRDYYSTYELDIKKLKELSPQNKVNVT